MIFKLAPFASCISEIIYPRVDNSKELDIIMPRHNLLEYGKNYEEIYGNILTVSQVIKLKILNHLNLKQKTTGNKPNIGDTKDTEMVVPLKYLSIFW